jgi:hypothetical protein
MKYTILILAFAVTSSAQVPAPGPTEVRSLLETPIVLSIGDHGTVSIKDFRFLPKHDYDLKADFSFEFDSTVKPPSPATITLSFEVGGFCDGDPRQWTGTASLVVTATSQIVNTDFGGVQTGSITGCSAELVSVHLIQAVCQGFAKGSNVMAEIFRIQGERFERSDFTDQLLKIKTANAKRTEDVLKAEREQNRERADACSRLYRLTADKRIGDLTVKESQSINACQALGLYH